VTAHYAGNGTYGASDSTPPVQVTVSPEGSQTHVALLTFDPVTGQETSSNAPSAAYGSPYILRMDVTNSSGQTCTSATTRLVSYPCPTGSLTVSPAPTDQNAPAGTVPGSYVLNSQGFAEDLYIQQSPGTYNFVATYSGDKSYTGSTSPTDAVTITLAPTTTTLSGLPSLVQGNAQTVVTVTVNTQSSGVAPSCGDLRISDGTTPLSWGDSCGGSNGSASAPASLSATAYLTLPSGAQQSITAQFTGDSYYAPSTSVPVIVTVTDFSLSSNPASINIPAPGQSATATITITPLYGFTGTVSVQCNSPSTNPGMTCSIAPSSFTFSGSTPATATVTLSTTAPVNSVAPAPQMRVPPSSQAPEGGLWILAMMLCLAVLTSLAAKRRRAAALLLASALLVMGVWVACGGGGGGGNSPPPSAPVVAFSAPSLTFSQQTTGTTSPAQAVTLSNTGNATLTISSIGVFGANSGDFAQTSNCGGVVGAGSNCTISVTFTPSASGTRTASLTVADNASGSPQSVSLTGTGMAPTVTLSPSSLSFGQQDTGTTSAAQTVTLSNTGSASVNISDMAISLPYFVETNTCGSNLAAGTNCVINVTFTPQGAGTISGQLVVNDSAPGSPQICNLTGTGVQPTPPGSYTIQIYAQSGPENHTLNVPVTVQ